MSIGTAREQAAAHERSQRTGEQVLRGHADRTVLPELSDPVEQGEAHLLGEVEGAQQSKVLAKLAVQLVGVEGAEGLDQGLQVDGRSAGDALDKLLELLFVEAGNGADTMALINELLELAETLDVTASIAPCAAGASDGRDRSVPTLPSSNELGREI